MLSRFPQRACARGQPVRSWCGRLHPAAVSLLPTGWRAITGIVAFWQERRSAIAAGNQTSPSAHLSSSPPLRAADAANCRVSAPGRDQHRLRAALAKRLVRGRRLFLRRGAVGTYHHPFGRMSASPVDEFLCDKLFSDDDDDLISGKGLKAALASSRGAPISHHEAQGSVLRIHDTQDRKISPSRNTHRNHRRHHGGRVSRRGSAPGLVSPPARRRRAWRWRRGSAPS